MLRFTLLLFLIICSKFISAQEPSPMQVLDYRSPYEKQVFERLTAGDTALLDLLIVANGSADSGQVESYTTRLDKLFEELDSASLIRKSTKKIVKTVFNLVHDELLVQYRNRNQFEEIFNNGNYNCVSATAIYSFMLEGLGVEHRIIEAPNHVYVRVWHDDEDWVMESTDPQQGYYEINKDDYEKELDRLVDQKLITPQQRQSENLDSIINALFPSRAVSPKELVSFQYTNQAIYDYEDGKTYSAWQNAYRGYLIFTGEFQRTVLRERLLEWLDEEHYDDSLFYPAISLALSLDTSREFITSLSETYLYYGGQFQNGTITKNNFDRITDSFLAATTSIDTVSKSIRVYREILLGEYYLEQGNDKKTLTHASQTFTIDSLNDYAVELASKALVRLAAYEVWNFKQALDTLQVLQQKYPHLTSSSEWNSLYGELILQEMIYAIELQKLGVARQYQKQFEELMDNPQLEKKVNSQLIGLVYGQLGLKNYNRSKDLARKTINKGLQYAPNSKMLLRYKNLMRL